jgi:hypothetical protein
VRPQGTGFQAGSDFRGVALFEAMSCERGCALLGFGSEMVCMLVHKSPRQEPNRRLSWELSSAKQTTGTSRQGALIDFGAASAALDHVHGALAEFT